MYAINQKHQKAYNRSLVLHSLSHTPELSRAELATRLNLKKSSLTPIIANLLDLGILREIGLGEGRKEGGRKPILLRLNDDFGGTFGVDLQPQVAYLVLVSLGGKILYKGEYRFSQSELSLGLFEKFEILYQYMMERAEEFSCRILGISLGIPGWVNNRDGILLRSIPFNLESYNFSAALEESNIEIPVLIENDANCGAWSEVHQQDESIQDFLFLLFVQRPPLEGLDSLIHGVALGVGVTLNGEIYRGEHFSAGDFTSAHWRINNKGQVGIAESRMNELLESQIDPLKQEEIFREYFYEILQNLIPVITTLAPAKIILGGNACGKLALFQDIMQSELRTSYLGLEGMTSLFVESPYGMYAPAYGAARRFLWELFYPVIPTRKESYYQKGLKSLFND